MTDRQRKLARHALGLPNSHGESYKNRYIAGPSHCEYQEWQRMVLAGYAMQEPSTMVGHPDYLFYLTRAGAELALETGEILDREDFD